MGSATTLGGAIGDILYSSVTATFTWVPATILSILQGATLPDTAQPVTPADLTTYVQQTADPSVSEIIFSRWATFVTISVIISLIFSFVLVYCIVHIFEVRRKEREARVVLAHTVTAGSESKTQLRWNRVLDQMLSNDEQNWRLAILEADIMLNELLDSRGYKGETMGDKMKQVDRSDFNTIDLAWEAHKVRNAIAHQGSARLMNEREARRVIGLYEQVFREFGFVE